MSRVSVSVNGLSLVHEDSGGVSTATLPDVCLSPPAGAPVPYSNVARSRDLASGSIFVRADGGNRIAIAGSVFARSKGDEAGSGGGVTSGVTGEEASWLSHSFDVSIEGRGACRLTDKMLHNRANTLDCAGVVQKTASKSGGKGEGAKGKGKGAHQTKDHRLEVKVIDAQTKASVPGAHISLRGPEGTVALADASGKHLFKKLDSGHFEITVTHDCYPDASSRVHLTRKSQTRVVRLDPRKLKDVAHSRGVEVGGRVNIAWNLPAPDYGTDGPICAAEYHGTPVGTFWTSRCPDSLNPVYPGSLAALKFDYAAVDNVVTLAAAHGLWLEGTPLVWTAQKFTPNWANTMPGITPKKGDKKAHTKKAKLARQELALSVVKDFVGRVMTKYPQIERWVLLNEVMNLRYNGGARAKAFWKAFGIFEGDVLSSRHSLAEIFRLAHEKNKKAILIINDFDVEGWDGGSSKRGERGRLFYELVEWLVKELSQGKRRVPRKNIAAGFQMHVPATDKRVGEYRQDYRPSSMRKQVERFKKLGVKVYVTELDIVVPGMNQIQREEAKIGTDEATFVAKNKKRYAALFRAQKKRYHDIFRALLDGDNCPSITTWGILDGAAQFRYFGYMLSPYFGCAPPGGGYFRKPAYFGALTAMHGLKK